MKIRHEDNWLKPSKRTTISAFADIHNLTMVVTRHSETRYTAHFDGAEVKEGSVLGSMYGDADSPEAAMQNYALQISGKLLVVHAFRPDRDEIYVPDLNIYVPDLNPERVE